MTRDITEAHTRAERIDQQLARAGWHPSAVAFEAEYEVGSVGDPDHGFSDYALPGDDGLPLAIVEAKRSSRDALAGKEQSQRYVEAIEARTGRRPVVFLANGNEIWFWDLVSNPRPVSGFFSRDDLARRLTQLTQRRPLAATSINNATVERLYQHEAIRRAQEAFTEGRRRALWVMATGTGKTRTAVALIESMMEALWVERVLFLVDRDALATQALEAFQEHLPSEPAERIYSTSYDPSRRLYVATLQTMQDFYPTFPAATFDLVISDESHRSIYDKWEAVITYFDAYLLGLTATPADFLDRNTFGFFHCPTRVPTFAYEYEQAVEDGYLVPFEAYHARTQIQIGGVHGTELPPDVQQALIEQGIDPGDIDFAGTEIERKFTNAETTRLIVTEFFENALKDPGGSLPGKSIIFALSHAHAKRLYETFLREYPQFPGLVEIIDSHMEDPKAMLRRFKRESMPRVAITVDMLDTGVDVPTVTNLAIVKPVLSKIKFWQMIGRGTRKVEDTTAAKPWCPIGTKTVFRVLDFGSNFERFQLNPDGVEPSSSVPVAVRAFRILVRAARAASDAGMKDLREDLIAEVRQMIAGLPVESAGVREERRLVEDVADETFWLSLTPAKYQLLGLQVAPLMRFLPARDLAGMQFSTRCLEWLLEHLAGEDAKAAAVATKIRDDVLHLPIEHPGLADRRDVILEYRQEGWIEGATVEQILDLRERLSAVMKLRQPEPTHIITLDLADAFSERRWLTVGPDATEFDAADYRAQVEAHVRALSTQHPAMLKLSTGEALMDQDITAIEAALDQPDLYITEDSLRAAYRAPHGSLVALLRHALDIETLKPREDAINEAFEAFTAEKSYLNADQLTFVRLFARRLMQAGRVERADLYEQPFTRLGGAVDETMTTDDLDDLFALAVKYEVA